MNKHNKLNVFKSLAVLVFCLLVSNNVFADENGTYTVVANNLSKKLRNDLADAEIKVKLTKVTEYKISSNQLGINGDGVCILTGRNEQMLIRFNAKLDTINQEVSDISYDFVEASPSFAPSSNEEILMQELMKQISKDYGTENIVIAIDGYEDISILTNKKEFTGVGEVRIGDLVWNKIKFDIVLNPENKLASKIAYSIEK